MREQINELHTKLSEKPDSEKMGFCLSPGGILNAYREGDISFTRAVERLTEWAVSQRSEDTEQQDQKEKGTILEPYTFMYTLRALIGAEEEYINFLGSVIEKEASFLRTHGIMTSDEDIATGKKLRNKIANLKAKLTGGV